MYLGLRSTKVLLLHFLNSRNCTRFRKQSGAKMQGVV
jgi:hypothetical protein